MQASSFATGDYRRPFIGGNGRYGANRNGMRRTRRGRNVLPEVVRRVWMQSRMLIEQNPFDRRSWQHMAQNLERINHMQGSFRSSVIAKHLAQQQQQDHLSPEPLPRTDVRQRVPPVQDHSVVIGMDSSKRSSEPNRVDTGDIPSANDIFFSVNDPRLQSSGSLPHSRTGDGNEKTKKREAQSRPRQSMQKNRHQKQRQRQQQQRQRQHSEEGKEEVDKLLEDVRQHNNAIASNGRHNGGERYSKNAGGSETAHSAGDGKENEMQEQLQEKERKLLTLYQQVDSLKHELVQQREQFQKAAVKHKEIVWEGSKNLAHRMDQEGKKFQTSYDDLVRQKASISLRYNTEKRLRQKVERENEKLKQQIRELEDAKKQTGQDVVMMEKSQQLSRSMNHTLLELTNLFETEMQTVKSKLDQRFAQLKTMSAESTTNKRRDPQRKLLGAIQDDLKSMNEMLDLVHRIWTEMKKKQMDHAATDPKWAVNASRLIRDFIHEQGKKRTSESKRSRGPKAKTMKSRI